LTKTFKEKFKIESKIFDQRTLNAIFKLMKKGFIKFLVGVVKEGKESVVLSAKDLSNRWVAVKVYRTAHCDFKSMWKYLANDPRFTRIRKSRWHVVLNWCKREYKNLKIAFENKVSCPKPITFIENVLVMGFIGKNGVPAPRLIDVKLRNYSSIYKRIVNEMKKLAKANLIHTDLSPYNILISDKPYIFDFSQAITNEHPLAKNMLRRDVKNVNKFFEKKGVNIDKNLYEKLCKIMWQE
jgi:RIO kinase 1